MLVKCVQFSDLARGTRSSGDDEAKIGKLGNNTKNFSSTQNKFRKNWRESKPMM